MAPSYSERLEFSLFSQGVRKGGYRTAHRQFLLPGPESSNLCAGDLVTLLLLAFDGGLSYTFIPKVPGPNTCRLCAYREQLPA